MLTKRGFFIFLAAAAVFVIVIFFLRSETGTQFAWNVSGGGTWLLPLVGIAALIDSVNPCAFSILLLTVAFLFSVGQLRSGILKIGGTYILGLFLAYFFIGLGILQTFHFFNTPNFMARLGAALLLLLGILNIINAVFPRFPIKLRIPHSAHGKMAVLVKKGSLPTAFLLGGLVGVCEFPCTGGPYLAVLGLLHDSTAYFKGVGYLVLYNLIFILPLVIILLLASNRNLLEKVQNWQRKEARAMRWGGGLAMIALGLFILVV